MTQSQIEATSKWARHAAAYCAAVAPYATPFLELAERMFSAVDDTQKRLEAADQTQLLISKYSDN